MGRLGSALLAISTLVFGAGLVGCGGHSAKSGTTQLPAVITLSPSIGSIDLGSALAFSATVFNGAHTQIAIPLTYTSSNSAVLTIATGTAGGTAGLACAGTWDSLTNPVVCTPGGAGVVQVTASASGVSSAPVTVYVHQHIDRILISPVPPPPPGLACYTAAPNSTTTAHTQIYQASAFSNGVDITSSVGPFTWSAVTPSVVTLTPLTTNGVVNGQVQAAANTPGITQISASISNTNSSITMSSGLLDFTTCAVQSISLAVSNGGGTSINVAKGTSSTITAAVTDTQGNALPSAPLTWTSSEPDVAAVTARSGGLTASVSDSNVGGASIFAACTPPSCNINFVPLQAVYATPLPVSARYTGTSAQFTVYVGSTGCGANLRCVSLLAPISGTTKATLGSGIALTNTPNSLRFSNSGINAYLGSQAGLMQVVLSTSSTTSNLLIARGKILAISPDGNTVIVSDNQAVFIVSTSSSLSLKATLPIAGVTAAKFSPDNLKAFILAGSTLYIYSTQAALQPITLNAPATDVDFLANGMAGYMAGGDPAGVSFLPVCEDPHNFMVGPIPTSGTPVSIRAVPNQTKMLALNPPDIDLITANIGGTVAMGAIGCPAPFPFGYLSIQNPVSSFGLGQGSTFILRDFLVSSDGAKAYVIAANLANVVTFDVAGGTTSTIPLMGNPAPLAAALAPDGGTLYVSTNDGVVHLIDTSASTDAQQVPVPSSALCAISTGGPPPQCLPDLLAVKPK